MNAPFFNIAAVERDVGLSKDVLRMWERRYGFPLPERDANGERLYSAAQVERLRLMKRLMDQGHRPGKLMELADDELATLAPRSARPTERERLADHDPGLGLLLDLIRRHDGAGYVDAMQQRLARDGLHRFVQDTVAPLTESVGQAWERGELQIFEEHLFTELTKRLLRQAIAALPAVRQRPRVILTTVPGEQHSLGLLMVEALFSLEGAQCIPLGTEMPLLELSRAVSAHQADVVALSFSIAFPARQIGDIAGKLRSLLPAEVELWIGGAGVARVKAASEIRQLPGIDGALAVLREWRAENSPATVAGSAP